MNIGDCFSEVRGIDSNKKSIISDGKHSIITLNMLNIDDTVDECDAHGHLELLDEYGNCFAVNNYELGCTTL